MKRYSIYWTFVVNNGDEISEGKESCDVIASNFKKAIEWLTNNKQSFSIESIYSVYVCDVNIAE